MKKDEIFKLVTEVKVSRHAIGRDISRLGDELNLTKKAAEVVRRNPFAWVGSATFGGYLFTRFVFKGCKRPKKIKEMDADKSGAELRKKRKVEARTLTLWGCLIGVLRMLFPLFKPALSAYASHRIADMAASSFGRDK